MGWAIDSVLVRFGLRQSNIFAAMLMSYAVSITCVWSYLIATTSLEFLTSPAMIYYLISGCMQPIFARALFYEGITRIGVARAGPLRGIEPLFAATIALLVFNEQPGLQVYVGTVLIVASLWLISGKQEHDKPWRYVDALLPIGAALISAISQTLRKQALQIIPDPFVAVAMVTTVSLLLLLGFVFATGRTTAIAHAPQQLSLLFWRRAGCHHSASRQLHRLGPRTNVGDHPFAQHHAAIHGIFQRAVPAQGRNRKPAHHRRRDPDGRRRRPDHQPREH